MGYEWMVNSEEFDSQAMQQIEQDDDLDDMFYWDPSKGCTKGKSTLKKEQQHQQQSQTENNNNNNNYSLFQNFNSQPFQNNYGFQNVQDNNNQKLSDKNFITNPFSCNFQNNAEIINQNQNNNNNSAQNINKQEQQKNSDSGLLPGDDLARAMGGVNLNKFHLNPEATTFVPSWLKK